MNYLKVTINNKMFYYDRIDSSEGIDINKANASKLCDICNNWYFLDKVFKFKPDVCNGCLNLINNVYEP